MAGAGYVEPTSCSSFNLTNLQVMCLNGDGCVLSVEASTLGREVLKMVSRQLPWKKGARISLHRLDLPLMLHQTLQEQGIVDNTTLSCTFVPTDLFAAWSYLKGFPVPEAEVALEGLTWITGKISTESLHHLPRSLESLAVLPTGTYSLEEVSLPSALRCLTLDYGFNQEMKGVALPSGLQELTFGRDYNQSLRGVSLRSNLKSLTFGDNFDQSLEGVDWPSCLENLTWREVQPEP